MRNDIGQTIKEALPMPDVVRFYGFAPNRAGFICCPFHGEKTPSCKIYKDHWHCFGCGEGGSSIDFVMKLFGLRFPAAVVRLNSDFHLGLSAERPDRADLELLKARRAKEKAEKEAREREYMAHLHEFRRLHDAFINAPPDSEAYAEACRRLSIEEAWLDDHPYSET